MSAVDVVEYTPPGTWSADDVPEFGQRPTHARGADLTLYWPWVRPCWEDPSVVSETTPNPKEDRS